MRQRTYCLRLEGRSSLPSLRASFGDLHRLSGKSVLPLHNSLRVEEHPMRRTYLVNGIAGAAVATMLACRRPVSSSPSIGERPTAVRQSAPSAHLPISHVYLFSSGVGYFQREGEIEGTTRVDLSFPASDVNDL